MRKAWLIVAIVTAFTLAAAPGAAGQSLPPDNSAIDEYTENVPGPGGDQPSDEIGGGGGSGAGSGSSGGGSDPELPPGVVDELNQAGPDGAAAADLAQAAGPSGNQASHQRGGANGTGDRSSADRGSERPDGGGLGGLVDSVVGETSASGGTGIVLPIVLGSALLAAVLFLIARRRGSGEPGSA